MTPEVGFIAGVLVCAAILGSRWAAEERKRAAELETIINLIQQLARLEGNNGDEHSSEANRGILDA